MNVGVRLASVRDRDEVLKIVERIEVAAQLVLAPRSSGWQYVEIGLRNCRHRLYVAEGQKTDAILGGGRLEPGGFSYFVHPEWWRQGLGLQIARQLLTICCHRLPGETIRLAIRRGNLSSIKIAEALGFRFSGSDALMPHALVFELEHFDLGPHPGGDCIERH